VYYKIYSSQYLGETMRLGQILFVCLFFTILASSVCAFSPFNWISEQINSLWSRIFGIEERLERLETQTTTYTTTSLPPTTTTTLDPGWECIDDRDCPQPASFAYMYKCINNNVYRITGKIKCINHVCVGEPHHYLHDVCSAAQICVEGMEFCQNKTTTTLQTTTTTQKLIECFTDDDCPTTSELRCRENTIINTTTRYRCMLPGTQQSYCLGRITTNPIKRCERREICVEGICTKMFENQCDQICHQNKQQYYCGKECSNQQNDKGIGKCPDPTHRCCCMNTLTPTPTLTTIHPAQTTTSQLVFQTTTFQLAPIVTTITFQPYL
jgi:hypothetical protein